MLVPLDFSHASLKALEYACALVDQFGADLHLVHVSDYDGTLPTPEIAAFSLSPAEIMRRSKTRLQEVATRVRADLPTENLHVVTGRAYHEICRLADNLGVDLIVTATRGNTGLKHFVLGSTAERVVQHAHCPVLIVRERERDFIQTNDSGRWLLRLKKILVPLDFSGCSMRGLEFAVPFAHFWNAELVLFNSIPMATFAPSDELGMRDFSSIDPCGEAGKLMAEVTSRTLERGVVAEPVVEVGPAARQICDYAARNAIDLIIIPTHGSTGLRHAMMGSTAEHVVRYAHSPVLVVPTRNRKAR